jgi:lipopolysaccharide transport system ATP-binding protein
MVNVVAENITVEFPIYGTRGRSLKQTFVRAATGGLLSRDAADRLVVRALNGLSFHFKEGDRVGIVGHNGSGKTTLLRVIAGAYEPISGSIHVTGKVATMLAIMLGMDPEATGYENIFLRATLMGFKFDEIEPLASEIVEFSELGDYIHMPLRTYSNGMAMRLAFAVSTSVSADILLMDEWLSAGDAAFTAKAQARLNSMVNRAKLLVLASHDENLIRRNCNKVMRLEHGQIVSFTDIGEESDSSQARLVGRV